MILTCRAHEAGHTVWHHFWRSPLDGVLLAYATVGFLGVVQDVVSMDPLAVADLGTISVIQMYRSPPCDSAMLFIACSELNREQRGS